MRTIPKNSPSNIQTGWRQKFFYKIESDGLLDEFIEIFSKNGNNWSMPKKVFDEIVSKKRINDHHQFTKVYNYVFETKNEVVSFRTEIIEELLSLSWRWSLKNALKNLW